MSEIITFRINQDLTGIEDSLVDLFTSTVEAEQMENMGPLARMIERHGCEGYLTAATDTASAASPPISMRALDVAWFVPDVDWRVSKGRQVCWSRSTAQESERWYEQVLQCYFRDAGAASLLTLPDVYTASQFVNLSWLSVHPKGKSGSSIGNSQPPYVFTQLFNPRHSNDSNPGDWEDHFQRYRELVAAHLSVACPEVDADRTMLGWIYVGPGRAAEAESPPHWGASIFFVLQLNERPPVSGAVPPSVDMLLGNLLRALRNAAPAALGNRREKQSLAQVLAHEFKNIAGEAANLASEVRGRAMTLAHITRHPAWRQAIAENDLVELGRRADCLNYCAQSSGAFAIAAYWLFSPKSADTPTMQDPGAVHFRHALALTLRIVGANMGNWRLDSIPDEQAVVTHFKSVGLKADGIQDLPSDFSVSVMVFFALEAVRNIKKGLGSTARVQFTIGGEGTTVELRATTEGSMPKFQEKSASIAALIEEVHIHCPWQLIEIDPFVRTEISPVAQGAPLQVTRITSFKVFRIPPLNAH